MKSKLIWPAKYLLILPFFSLFAEAQISSIPEGKGFVPKTQFNSTFIKKNGIAEIEVSIDLKKDGDKIRDQFQSEIYTFHESGKVESILLIDHKRKDTSLTYYSFNDELLRCEIKNDRAGLYSYCYTYTNDLPSSIQYSRSKDLELLNASVSSEFKKEVSEERIEHKKYENQLHSTYFNSANRPYSKEIRYFDENGYYTKFLKTYVMTSTFHKETYSYNEKGFLSEVLVETNTEEYRLKYEYNDFGQILAESRFENDSLIYRAENVFFEDSMLLKAHLKRHEIDGNILIKSYTYHYN